MVPKASEDFPEPETPENTTSALRGMETSTSLRLFSRAPRTCTRPLAAAVQEDSPKELFGMFLSCSSSRSGRDFLSSGAAPAGFERSEEHTSELQSLMRISYAVFCLKKKNKEITKNKY